MARGPITVRDVVIEFFLHEWEFLNPLQKKLYCIVMMENYSNVVSIGHFISKPHIIVLLEEERDPWMVMKEETRSWNTDLDSSYKIISNRKMFVSGKHSSLFLHQIIHGGEKLYEECGKVFCCAPHLAQHGRVHYGADCQDSKIASVLPLKKKKLLDVKLRELPSWILMWDFIPKGIAGAFQRGYCQYYNKLNMKKRSVAGLSVVLAAYMLINCCHSYKELCKSLGLFCLWWGFLWQGGIGSLSN